MPTKDPAKRAKHSQTWYASHQEEQASRTQQYRAANKERIAKYKLAHGCAVCSYSRCLEALEFHHVDGREKNGVEQSIGKMAHRGMSWGRIEEELKKCMVLCANCHREVHAEGR